MNKGTCTTAPVSRVAGLVEAETVSPLIPGSVWVTVRSRNKGTRIPMGRWGTPEDLQGACLLLASEAGDYIHGTDIAVDGGWLAW